MATTNPDDELDVRADDGEPICVLALCEQNSLLLKPNQLYRFDVMKDCDECNLIAEGVAGARTRVSALLRLRPVLKRRRGSSP